jgi:hypothetical protein
MHHYELLATSAKSSFLVAINQVWPKKKGEIKCSLSTYKFICINII